jgi:glycosyltransferase involved in cell wall biosynthesis
VTPNKADSHRKRVLVLTSTFPRWEGDTEPAFVYTLCERLSERFDLWVLAPHAPGAKTKESFGSIQVMRFRYFFEWGENLAYQGGIIAKLRSNRLRYLLVPSFLVLQWIAILRLLLSQRFDVVHAHWLFPQGFAAAIAKCLLPVFPALVCTSHGTDLNGLQGGMFTRIKRFVVSKSDAFTVVSSAMCVTGKSLGAKLQKMFVIPMGVDAQCLFTPNKEATRQHCELLFVGRLDAQKGVDVLIRSMTCVVAARSNCSLKIIGDGPERKKLQEQVNRADLSEHIKFVGAISNTELPEKFRVATLTVFPSTGPEGLGLVCAEALACECPVVASDWPAIHEVVQNGISGLLFRPGDWEDLAQKILLLLANHERRNEMGVAGRKYVLTHFDWEQVAADFSEVYNRIGS